MEGDARHDKEDYGALASEEPSLLPMDGCPVKKTNKVALISLMAILALYALGAYGVVRVALPMAIEHELQRECPGDCEEEILKQASNWQTAASNIRTLLQFFTNPAAGHLSDRFGRKFIFAIALAGSIFANVALALMPVFKSIWLAVVSSVLVGLTDSCMTVGAAAISDVSSPKSRTKNLGIIGLSVGLGMFIGPQIYSGVGAIRKAGWINLGAFTDSQISLGFAVLSALMALILLLIQKEPHEVSRRAKRISFCKLLPGVNFFVLLKSPVLAITAAVSFTFHCASESFNTTFVYYAKRPLYWSKQEISLALSYYGLMTAILQGLLIRVLSRWIPDEVLLVSGLFMGMGGFLWFGFARHAWEVFILLLLLGFSSSVIYPTIKGISANFSRADEVGQVQSALRVTALLSKVIGQQMSNLLFKKFMDDQPGTLWWSSSGLLLIAGLMSFILALAMYKTRRIKAAAIPVSTNGDLSNPLLSTATGD